MKRGLWWLAKALEGVGLVLVLVGLSMSMKLGFVEQKPLESMVFEMRGLIAGGLLFALGYLIERRIGAR